MDYVLGIDAGNTKTIALVAQRDGTIIAGGRDGCGDIYGARSAEAALAAIESAAEQALQQAGVHREALAAAAFSAAGADWPEDHAFLEAEFAQMGLGRRIVVVNDAIGALWAELPSGCGVVVVCGTGAATGARGPDGQTWHASFWQEPQGADHLARQALRAVYRADLGIDPPTALTAPVLAYFGAACVEEVLHFCTARIGSPPANLPGLARMLLDTAASGDPTARRLVEAHGAALGDYALAAARQVGIADRAFPLVLAGGVLRHPSPLLADALVARVQTGAPGATPVRNRFEPAIGALFLALQAAGTPINDALLARLVPTLPPPLLFET